MTRGIRNDNPTNIRYVEGITSTYVGCTAKDDAGFCIFDTPEHGIQAAARALLIYQTKHGLNTVAGIIGRWAPSSENDTAAYVAAVSSEIGIGPDEQLDLHSPSVMQPLVTAIIRHENGEQPYTAEEIAAGVYAALGEPLQPRTPRPTTTAAQTPQGASMGIALALLPLLAQYVPQLMTLIKPNSASMARDSVTAQKALNIAAQVAGVLAPDGGDATAAHVAQTVDKLSSDPSLVKQVQQAIVTHPDIMPILEIGAGGIAAARVANTVLPEAPWWSGFSQPVFVFGLILCGMILLILGNILGMPWGGEFQSWSSEVRASVISAVIGGALGAITGYWFGTTQQSGKKDQVIAQQAADTP